jgi:hypothetical protein
VEVAAPLLGPERAKRSFLPTAMPLAANPDELPAQCKEHASFAASNDARAWLDPSGPAAGAAKSLCGGVEGTVGSCLSNKAP